MNSLFPYDPGLADGLWSQGFYFVGRHWRGERNFPLLSTLWCNHPCSTGSALSTVSFPRARPGRLCLLAPESQELEPPLSTSPLSPRRKSGRPRTVFSQAVQTSVKSLPVNPPWLHTPLTNLNCCLQAWAEISVTFWRWSRQEKSFPSYSFRLISLLSLPHWWNPKLQK